MSHAEADSNGVGTLLRRHRAASGLTQEELAQRSGLSVRAIADIERGRTRPYRRTVLLLADALMLSEPERDELADSTRAAKIAWTATSATADPPAIPDIVPAQTTTADPARPQIVPRQLPAAVSHFTGRSAELAALNRLLDSDAGSAGTVLISAIGGTAGVGKTALAVYWAHQVADLFPDGQLYVSLQGFTPSGLPLTPGEAIRSLLEALGVPSARIPLNLDARAAFYRSLLAGRKMLVLLDNARDADQVRPLLPGDPDHMVLVTSRNQLAGLVASDGARPLYLDVLTEKNAAEMLAARLGEERLAAEAGATIELIGLCARLPLALSIVTARALGRPGSTIATLAAELREARSRLDQLDTGDASTSVRAVFSWSYQTLSNPAARMFRLLGACPGPDISMPAAAALAGEPTDRVSLMLLELTGTQLVAPHAEGRFAFHDLLRSYAMERSAAQEVSADRDAAIRRLLYWYLHTATAAARTVNPRRRHVSVDTAPHGVAPLAFSSYDEGLAWLDAEHANLVAAVELAAVQGEHEIAWKLPLSMWDLFSLRGLFDDWIAAHQTGLASAEQIDERVGQAWILNNLGGAYMLQDRDGEALACYERVLPLLPDLRNTHSEASILHNLGLMQMRLDQHAVALDTLGTALAAYSNLGDLDGEGHTLNTIGETLRLLGRFDEALSCYEQAVRNFRETGNRFGESLAITDEGQALLELGDHGRAIERADRAAALSREIGHLPGEAHARQILGHALRGSGRPDEARENWMLTAKIYEDLGDSRAAKIRALL